MDTLKNPGDSGNDIKILRTVYQQLSGTTRRQGRHLDRIRNYVEALASDLAQKQEFGVQWEPNFATEIGFLSTLHDVGEIGTPLNILKKTGKLNAAERELMQEHTINGAFILNGYPDPRAREIALYHHERWDGSGYPYGLLQDLIPLSARIVAVVDVYDALRSPRSYKENYSHKQAIRMILSNADILFDPEIIESFLDVGDRFEEIFQRMQD